MQIKVTNLCEDCPEGCDWGIVRSEIESTTTHYMDEPRGRVDRELIISCDYADVCKFKGTNSYMEDECK